MNSSLSRPAVPIEKLEVAAFKIPTDAPESDGTLEWDSTTLVVAHAEGGGERGPGYSYGDGALVRLIADVLKPEVDGRDARAIPGIARVMRNRVRNSGVVGATRKCADKPMKAFQLLKTE